VCTEDLSTVTYKDVLIKLEIVLNPKTEKNVRLDASAWLERLQTIERGFGLSMEILELTSNGQLGSEGAQFAALTLQLQCANTVRKQTLQNQQEQIVERLVKYLQFFMIKRQRNISYSLAGALLTVLFRSTIKVKDQVGLFGNILEDGKSRTVEERRALNETVTVCLSMVPEVSQTRNIRGIVLEARRKFNLDWKGRSNQVIELLANMIREHPGLQEVVLNCVAGWLGWARASSSESLG